MNLQTIKRSYNFSAILRSDPAVGEWVAHCPDLDVFSQGTSIPHAFSMLVEAISIVLGEDLLQGRDPLERNAPAELWQEFFDAVRLGSPVPFAEVPSAVGVKTVALQLRFNFELRIRYEGVFDRSRVKLPTPRTSTEVPLSFAA